MTDEFVRVSAAKKLYFSGAMSLRWWYRQIEEGRLPHFRAGASVLLRVADVEAFVAEMFRDKATQPPEEPATPVLTTQRKSAVKRSGLKFFPD